MNRNYGPTILAQRHAEMQGLQQVLWLFGEERQVRSCSLALNNTYGEKKLDSFFLKSEKLEFPKGSGLKPPRGNRDIS